MPWLRTEEVSKGAVIQVMSILPGAMDAVANLNRATTFDFSASTRVQEEFFSITVATINCYRY